MTAAIVLAAGRATRFGGGKLLAHIDGRPMLVHVLHLARAAGLAPIVLVTGDETAEFDAAIPRAGEVRVRNSEPGRGISSSLAIGLAWLADSAVERVVVMLGDQPRLSIQQLAGVTTTDLDATRPIVVPRYAGIPGNPVLLEREAWPLAAALQGDRGMSQLFAERPELVRYVDLPGANPDVDTATDLERINQVADYRSSGFVLLPGEGRQIDLGNFVMVVKADEQTEGSFVLLEATEPARFGPPLHIHHDAAEAFYVLEGSYDVFIADRAYECPAGSFIFIPAGVEHSFRVGPGTSRKLNLFSPAAMVGYFDELSAALKSSDMSEENLKRIAVAHGMEVTGSVPEGYL